MLPKRNACESVESLSKNTLLSLLRGTNRYTPAQLSSRIRCLVNDQGLTEEAATLLANQEQTPPHFLEKIPDANWSILSFEPISRVVCVRINKPAATTLSITLPFLTAKS
jgi:hypothetical protein